MALWGESDFPISPKGYTQKKEVRKKNKKSDFRAEVSE